MTTTIYQLEETYITTTTFTSTLNLTIIMTSFWQIGIISIQPQRIWIPSHIPVLVVNGTSIQTLNMRALLFRCAEAIRKGHSFDKDVPTAMEYACGTGLELSSSIDNFFNKLVMGFRFSIRQPRSVCQVDSWGRH